MLLSHPAWVCGLKRVYYQYLKVNSMSHPAWVCGLKHAFDQLILYPTCHTLRGCVD